MGKYFSDVVEKAIEDLYYCYDNIRADEAADALFHAAKEQEDGDACYFLSRCFSGPCYSWRYHPFKENDAAAFAMLRRGISLGSAVAVLGALRMDMLTPELREIMPFSSLREAWEAVCQKAEDGCLFCQYMIGNTYYFLDVIEIDDRKASEFDSRNDWEDWEREQMAKSIPWFEKAFAGGMGMAGRNLRDYYEDGRGTLIPPQPQKALEVKRQGAELGYPDWMYSFGNELYYNLKQKKEGISWCRKAAELGHLAGWNIVGDGYRFSEVVEQDLPYALECYERSAAHGDDSYASYRAGEMYFRGLGTRQDYARAVQYLEQCYVVSNGRDKDTDMLGLCYLLGYGCQQNPERAKVFLEQSPDTVYKKYGLGMMYAEGIGVPEDIARGVEYLKAAGNYEPAKKALGNYKKSLFGIWRRR